MCVCGCTRECYQWIFSKQQQPDPVYLANWVSLPVCSLTVPHLSTLKTRGHITQSKSAQWSCRGGKWIKDRSVALIFQRINTVQVRIQLNALWVCFYRAFLSQTDMGEDGKCQCIHAQASIRACKHTRPFLTEKEKINVDWTVASREMLSVSSCRIMGGSSVITEAEAQPGVRKRCCSI